MKRISVIAALAVAMVSCGNSNASAGDEAKSRITPPEKGVIRLVSYNVGVFNKYTNSMDMVAKMMKELSADAVGMNETDSCTIRTAGVYQAKAFAEKLGNWHYCFARSMPYNNGAYGNSIVVSPDFKVTGKTAIPIPVGSGREPRSCAVVTTDKFVFMAAHLDHTDEAARLEGVRLITSWALKNYGDSDIPVFLCGDMNCGPDDAPIALLKQDWELISATKSTFPSTGSNKCIDFIFALDNKARYDVVGSDVPLDFESGSVTEASDHLPVYVDVKLK